MIFHFDPLLGLVYSTVNLVAEGLTNVEEVCLKEDCDIDYDAFFNSFLSCPKILKSLELHDLYTEHDYINIPSTTILKALCSLESVKMENVWWNLWAQEGESEHTVANEFFHEISNPRSELKSLEIIECQAYMEGGWHTVSTENLEKAAQSLESFSLLCRSEFCPLNNQCVSQYYSEALDTLPTLKK